MLDNELDIIVRLPYKMKYFVIERDFIAYCEIDGIKREYIISKGEKSDFASIPTFLHWWLEPTDPTIAIPSVIHDYLCHHPEIMERKQADIILLQKCISFGMNPIKALLVYFAVRIGSTQLFNLIN